MHGAPVTAEVLAAGAGLRLVGCARGGPVNVDLDALSARGLPLVNTPGKNSEAVADLTLAFLVMLARGIPKAQRSSRTAASCATTGRARGSWAPTCAGTRSGWSVTARSDSGWPSARWRSA